MPTIDCTGAKVFYQTALGDECVVVQARMGSSDGRIPHLVQRMAMNLAHWKYFIPEPGDLSAMDAGTVLKPARSAFSQSGEKTYNQAFDAVYSTQL